MPEEENLDSLFDVVVSCLLKARIRSGRPSALAETLQQLHTLTSFYASSHTTTRFVSIKTAIEHCSRQLNSAMSSQELPQLQRQKLESGPSMETTMQQAGAAPSEETTTQEAEPKQEVPSSDPAVPSSDAILPSSPSPAKHLPNTTTTSNTHTTTTPADNIDPTSNPASTQPPNPTLHALHQKLTHLQSHLHHLQHHHKTHLHAHSTLPSGLPLPPHWTPAQIQTSALETANSVIKEHIALLHGYNEIKDVGMGLLGLVAEKRGVRVRSVMEEFGVGEGD